jgi:sugar lactone lactonase YvrE
MATRVRWSHALPVSVILAAFLIVQLSWPAAAVDAGEVVVSGLSSPRGLVLLPNGSLALAEAGKGGSGPCGPGPLGEMCVGLKGAVTHVTSHGADRLVRLPSIALPDGSFAFGTHDVATGANGIFATIGLAGSPTTREQWGPKGALLGHLVHVTKNGNVRAVADIAAYEAANNPEGGIIESDPYGLLRWQGTSVVTDAGGNSLLQVTDDGQISTLAVFHDRLVTFQGDKVEMDAVPTSVVLGPDGALYVGELTGFPYPTGGARIYRIVPGGSPRIFLKGFTNVIDIAFDGEGNLYVLEIAHNSLRSDAPFGELLRVSPSGERTVVLDQGLFFPTSVAVAEDGGFYVTNCGVCPGGGEVLKIEP